MRYVLFIYFNIHDLLEKYDTYESQRQESIFGILLCQKQNCLVGQRDNLKSAKGKLFV